MKCETALTEGRGQAFSLHLPLTVLLFMRLTFARWKGPESQGERKTLPAAGPERRWEECRAVLGRAGSGWDARPSWPHRPALPRGDPFTSRQLSGCLPLPALPLPARCAQPGSLPGKPWPSCPCLLHRRAGSTASRPTCCGCVSPGACVVEGDGDRSLSCPLLGYIVAQALLQAGGSTCKQFQGLEELGKGIGVQCGAPRGALGQLGVLWGSSAPRERVTAP